MTNHTNVCISFLILISIFLYPSGCLGNAQQHPTALKSRDLNSTNSPADVELSFNENGYVFFCLCMGRLGNQMDHFLGGLAFAKAINRTLVVPPFRTYKNVPYREWFRLEALSDYHSVIAAEDFMAHVAPRHWPPGQRVGFCWMPHHSKEACSLKHGSPHTDFWDAFGIDFDKTVVYDIGYYPEMLHKWNSIYPPEQYPVLAFRGAPARYPVIPEHRPLQRYVQISAHIEEEVEHYMSTAFKGEKFVGLHLRNGGDWVRACEHVSGQKTYMSSPQCTDGPVTADLCLPSRQLVLQKTEQAVRESGARYVYVATDKDPMIRDLEEHLRELKVSVVHYDPHLPLLDVAILSKADHFVGNCVSSFTAFVKRTRDAADKPSAFFGMQ